MTDLEIAERCAEALGYTPLAPDAVMIRGPIGDERWRPLTDAEQNQRVEWELIQRSSSVRIGWLGAEKIRHLTVVYGGRYLDYPCRTIEEKRRAVCMALCDVAGVENG